jgi:hypothetical protein
MILRIPFPETEHYTDIQISSQDELSWSGTINGNEVSYPWGVVPDAPWIILEFVNGGTSVRYAEPEWRTDLVTAYSQGIPGARYCLATPERLLHFASTLELVEYVCENTVAQSQFRERDVEHKKVWRYLEDSRITQEYVYSLHELVIHREQEECQIGWLSPRSRKTLSGKQQATRNMYRVCAEWQVERLTSFEYDEPIYCILPRLLPEQELDETFDWLDGYQLLERPFTWLREPTVREIEMLVDNKEEYLVYRANSEEVLVEIVVGVYLNAPFLISEHQDEDREVYVYPTNADILFACEGNSTVASEVEQKLFEMYAQA